MQQLKLSYFDITKLIKEVNWSLANRDDDKVRKDNFETAQLGKRQFLNLPRRREINQRGRYPLMQSTFGFLFGIAAIDREEEVGEILIETGTANYDKDDSVPYEALRLRMRYPIKNKSRPCKIEMIAEAEECSGMDIQRVDRVKSWGFFHETDLSKVIKTEWFFRDGIYQPKP
jgi:hypothetical protein